MKKLFLLSVLFLSVTGSVYAQTEPIRFNCGYGETPVINSDNNQVGCERPIPVSPTGCVTNDERPTVVEPVNGLCPAGSTSVINGSQVSSNITYVPLEPIPGLTPSANINFGDLLETIFKVLIILGGMIAVGAFVYAGITYMTSDVVGSKMDAIKRLNASLLGLLLLVSSWLILYTINPQLVRFSGVLNPSTSYAPTQQQSQQSQLCTNGAAGCAAYGNTPSQIQSNLVTEVEANLQQQVCLTQTTSGGRGGFWATGGGCTGSGNAFVLRRSDGSVTNYTGCEQVQTVAGYAACYYNQ